MESMKRVLSSALACAISVAIAVSLSIAISVVKSVFAAEAVVPVRLDANKMAGIGLTAVPPDPYKDILVAGELNMRVATLFAGKDLRVGIFESTPAKTDHRKRPTEGDEFVYVMSGKLILTEPGGKVTEYLPGNSVVVPAQYTGTWEMQGNYREIAVTPNKRK
jgi:uncharacterized cupin superfamily protein